MSFPRTVPLLLAVALVSACATPFSETPLATNFPTSKQEKLQAASHWQTITADAALRLSATLPAALTHPLYVEPVTPTAFNRAVTNQLITWLVNNGHAVTRSPANGAKFIKVDVDTQVVAFSPDRAQARYAGVPTALATGAWALSGPSVTGAGAATALIAGADAYSWARSEYANGETPQTEIILNLSVADEDRYLARSTTVYYVSDSDRKLYEESGSNLTVTSKSFVVKGD